MHWAFLYLTYCLVFYWGLTATLFALSATLPHSRYIIAARFLASWGALTFCACYGVVASIVLRLAELAAIKNAAGLSQWTTARSFKWTMWLLTGVRFVVQGEEYLRVRPAVFIGNHQTELDVLMLGTIFPPYCSVTAKSSLKYIPFLGWFMALSKTVFIDRVNRTNARAAFDHAASQMQHLKQSVYIFPEGTRSYASTADLLPFKKGAFHVAVQAKVPIVPIVVANYSNVLHVQTRTFERGSIPVKVLPPIPTEDLTSGDVEGLAERVRALMLDELNTLTEIARSQGVAMSISQAKLLNGSAGTTTARESRRKDVHGQHSSSL